MLAKVVLPDGQEVTFDYDALSRRVWGKYKCKRPIPGVKSGPAAPWFGQPGGGTQHLLPDTVGNLVNGGYLKPI